MSKIKITHEKVLDDTRKYVKNTVRRTSAPGSAIGPVKTVLSCDMVASAYGGCSKNENR